MEAKTCMCDGGGSIFHEPSLKCTVWHPQFEAEYERMRQEYEARKAAFPKPTLGRKVKDDF